MSVFELRELYRKVPGRAAAVALLGERVKAVLADTSGEDRDRARRALLAGPLEDLRAIWTAAKRGGDDDYRWADMLTAWSLQVRPLSASVADEAGQLLVAWDARV